MARFRPKGNEDDCPAESPHVRYHPSVCVSSRRGNCSLRAPNSKEAMADDEVDDEFDPGAVEEELDEDALEEDLDEDLVAADGDDGEIVVADGDEDEADTPEGTKARARKRASSAGEEEEDDEEEADPDDVEADLDTILKDRIAAADEEEDDEEEETAPKAAPETPDGVVPKRANEFTCTGCFLLVNRGQFGKGDDLRCPVGETDCPAIEVLNKPPKPVTVIGKPGKAPAKIPAKAPATAPAKATKSAAKVTKAAKKK